MENNIQETTKRKRSPLLLVVMILLVLALALGAAVFGLWFSGKNAMTQVDTTPELPAQETPSETAQEDDGNYVHYNGKRYEYNQSMINILLLGIDSTELPGESIVSQDQADVIVLAALDQKNNKITLINIPRDIMCDIDPSVGDGDDSSLIHAQLALSYALKSDPTASCELTRDTVSNIFFGLPIQGYGAYYMSGIGELNDAVGGVTLTVIADVDFASKYFWRQLEDGTWKQDYWYWRLTDGNTITLRSYEVGPYIQYRDTDRVDANEMRMQRQKQYMLALLSQAKDKFVSDPASILTMYDAVDDYMVTNLNLNSISYLATIASKMTLSGDILSLSGEYVLNEETNNAELYVDQQALESLMLDVFYTEVP